MSRLGLTSAAPDPALPALAEALDPERALPFLARVAGDLGWSLRSPQVRTTLLSHKAGRRCVIRYEWGEEQVRAPRPRRLVGKLYADPRRAARAYERMCGLRGQEWQAGDPTVPAPLLFVPELGLILLEFVPGERLQELVAREPFAGARGTPFALAGRWLERLHLAPPVAGLKERSLAQELGRIDGWGGEIAPHLRADEARRLHGARRRWEDLEQSLAPPQRVMIHKDYYPAHVLWDGRGVWVVDFDELAVGDPAFDVGHFLAHLEYQVQRSGSDPTRGAGAAARFRAAYADTRSGPTFDVRLRFYAAYTFLKLAATVARRKREGWETLVRSLAASACRESERADAEREG